MPVKFSTSPSENESPGQIARFRPLLDRLLAAGETFDIGLRINPLHSEGDVAKYDSAAPCSRRGFPVTQALTDPLEGVDGIHRTEEHTSALKSIMRKSIAVISLK